MGKNGGARPGAGRKPTAVGFRQWCRDVVMQPEVLEALAERALYDTDFALKVAEHGFGRPPQSLDVSVATSEQPQEFRAFFADAEAVPAAALRVPEGPPN